MTERFEILETIHVDDDVPDDVTIQDVAEIVMLCGYELVAPIGVENEYYHVVEYEYE